jgi:ABC-type antimicrobial peptide transport system permease subunit
MNQRVVLGILVGGLLGFALGATVYVVLNPMLEDASGWVRETQGLLWNLVPFLTVLGAVMGGLLLGRWTRPGS